MPKEEPLTGGQVIALTKKYLSGEDVAFVEKALLMRSTAIVGNSVNQVNPISSTLFKLPAFWQN